MIVVTRRKPSPLATFCGECSPYECPLLQNELQLQNLACPSKLCVRYPLSSTYGRDKKSMQCIDRNPEEKHTEDKRVQGRAILYVRQSQSVSLRLGFIWFAMSTFVGVAWIS